MRVCTVVKGVKLGSPWLHVPYWKVFGKDLWIRELYLIALMQLVNQDKWNHPPLGYGRNSLFLMSWHLAVCTWSNSPQ